MNTKTGQWHALFDATETSQANSQEQIVQSGKKKKKKKKKKKRENTSQN